MRRNFFLLVCAVLTFSLLMQSSGMADVQLCNVAAFKPTEGDMHPTYTWPLSRAVDESLEGVQCTCGPDTDNGYWKVDLGQEFDIEHLVINSRTFNPDRLNGAFLRAYDSTNTEVGSAIYLDGYAGVHDDPNTPENEEYIVDSIVWDNGGTGWQGVQYFQIGGVDDYGYGMSVPFLHIMEFQAMANVDCTTYPGFIEGVTVDDGGAGYAGYWGISPDYITDSSAMTDRHGVLNSPDAMSYSMPGGFWCTDGNYNETNVPTLTFDLGGSHNLDKMALWNIVQPGGVNNTRGFKDVTISTSTDGFTYTEISDANGAELGNFTFEIASEEGITEGETFGNQGVVDFSGVTASYVKITALNSHGSESYWGISEARFYETTTPVRIPGDANEDGRVDGSDVTILANNWQYGVGGSGGADWTMGDFNGDGQVDGSDVTILANNWQYGVTTAAANVPEPSTIVLILCGFGACLACFKRRK